MSSPKHTITLLLAHHECPKQIALIGGMAGSRSPVLQYMGKDHPNDMTYYKCPACGMQIAVKATVKEG